MPTGPLKPVEQQKQWRVRGGVDELRGLAAASLQGSGFSVLEEDASLEGAPYSGVALHQKVKIGMTYGAAGRKSGFELGVIRREKSTTGPAKLGETNRLNLWYYAQGENTFVHAHGLGMQKNLTEAFAALDSTFGPRAAPPSGRGP